MKKIVMSIVWLTLISSGFAMAELPKNNPVPGGIAVIPLSDSIDKKPLVRFGQQLVWIEEHERLWFALVGISQQTLPGKYLITVEHEDQSQYRRSFRVHPLAAVQEQGTIELPNNLNPIEFEYMPFPKLENSFPDPETTLYKSGYVFQQLVSSGSYVPYGRVLRQSGQSAIINHPWLTYITDHKEIVRSPAPGIVEQIYLSENGSITAAINHHNGLISLINNLGETILKPGQSLQTGDPIGIVTEVDNEDLNQSYGRVDWHLFLNGTLIDPLKLSSSS